MMQQKFAVTAGRNSGLQWAGARLGTGVWRAVSASAGAAAVWKNCAKNIT